MATYSPPSAADAPAMAETYAGVGSLRRHQMRLLYGGGGLLTALLVLIAILGIGAEVSDFATEQQKAFLNGKNALSRTLAQSTRGAINVAAISDGVWSDQRAHLVDEGRPLVELLLTQKGALEVSSDNARSTTWLVLLRSGQNMSTEQLAAYLGFAKQHSVLAWWTVLFSVEKAPFVYAFDPTETFFMIGGVKDERELLERLRVASRDEALDKLVSFDRGLSPHRTLPTSFGDHITYAVVSHPLTGGDALLTSVSLTVGGKEYLRRAYFQSLGAAGASLAETTDETFFVTTSDGQTIFESGFVPSAFRRASAGSVAHRLLHDGQMEGRTVWRGLGVPAVIGTLPETGWIVMHPYSAGDAWRDLAPAVVSILGATVLVTAGLWILLLRIDRRAFRPALSEAKRVYESEELNRTIIATSPGGLCLIEAATGTVLAKNNHVRDVLGGEDFQPSQSLYKVLMGHIGEWSSAHVAGRFFTTVAWPDGKVRQVEIEGTLAPYKGSAAWLCTFRDITAQKELEETLARAHRDAEKARMAAESASNAKSLFVATMSHEIRTPLHGILGHLELLTHSPLAPAQRERIVNVRQSADVLLSIISDVLDLSKIEAGQLEVVQVAFSVRLVVEKAALLFSAEANRKGIALYCYVDEKVDGAYVSDPQRISQILNNLLSNAVKFTTMGSVSLSVDLRADERGSWLNFVVADTGIGMASDHLARLFEPFVQVGERPSMRMGGTGLGLALSRQLATLLKGYLEVTSQVDVGSTFSLRIPAVVAERGSVASSMLPEMTVSALQGRVLLVEDHPANRELIRQQLEALGLDVDEAENGQDALTHWHKGAYDALLTDLNMPVMNGYDLVRRVRESDSHTPVLVVSASALASERALCKEVGVTELLLKPVSLIQLDAALGRYLKSPQSGRPTQASPSKSLGETETGPSEKVRAAFVRRATEDLQRLRSCMETGDAVTIGHIVHSFKGALLMLKETAPAGMCAQIEVQMERGRGAYIYGDLIRLVKELDAVVAKYKLG